MKHKNPHSPVLYHPSDDQLTEYSAGVLAMSRALCIATHIEHCHSCQQRIISLRQLGSAQLENLAPQKVSIDLKNSVLAKIKNNNVNEASDPAEFVKKSATKSSNTIPRCLTKWVPESFEKVDWSFVTPSVSISELCTEGSGAKVALVKVKAGGSMAHHSHTSEEITVILEGSFSDEDGCYRPGDYVFRDGVHDHKPIATNDQDCICLIVMDGPIQLTGWFSRLLNPLLRLNHKMPALAGS